MPKTFRPTGARIRPDGGWAAFVDQVSQQAKPKAARGGWNAANLRPPTGRLADWPKCICIARSTGQRCRKAAVTGSQRCEKHGGLLEVPKHKANRRRLPAYQERLERAAARTEFHTYPKDQRDAVLQAWIAARQAAGAKPQGKPWQLLLQGAIALNADAQGTAFRAWANQIKDETIASQTRD